MLKCEEFPNLAAILEFAFGESDRVVRAGGGLESHPRPTDTVLYHAADSNTIMKDTQETILALAPKGFNISLPHVLTTHRILRKERTKPKVTTQEEK